MENCQREHSPQLIAEVGKLPLHDKHKLVMPRCAGCAYEEGFVKGVELAANQVLIVARQLRQQHDLVQAAEENTDAAIPHSS